ncbi:MAG TPA: hypothetical protein PLZ61_02235 [Candidatus Cryosericum sp.]|nr:hypothetical protein [Candidatus Cryosericum sp.]
MEQTQVAKVMKIPGGKTPAPDQVCFFKDSDDRVGMTFDDGMAYIKSLGNRANHLLRVKGDESYMYARESAKAVYTVARKRGAAALAKEPMNIEDEILKARAAAGFTGVEVETPPQDDEVDFDAVISEDAAPK